MYFLKKNKGKIFSVCFLILTIIVIIVTTSNTEFEEEVLEEDLNKDVSKEEVSKSSNVLVDIKGEVNSPGVYEFTSDNTVNDAINKAGGLTDKGDTSKINLSKKLTDEMVIIVYNKDEVKEDLKCEVCVCDNDKKAEIRENDLETSKININTATLEELMLLNGIGESKASAIIKYREENGPFEDISDIKNVSGIGDSAFEKIKDYITV